MADTPPYRWPLMVSPENRDETTAKDAKLINGYIERSAKGETWIYKRPGLAASTAVTAAAGLGCFLWGSDVYSIFGATLYKNGVAIPGAVNTTGGVYSWETCLGSTPKVFFQNGVVGYTYDSVNGLVAVPVATTVATTGTLTQNSATITGIPSTASLKVGATVIGTGIPSDTTIKSIDSGTQVTLTSAVVIPVAFFTATGVTNTTGGYAPCDIPLTGITPSTSTITIGAQMLDSNGNPMLGATGATGAVKSVDSASSITVHFGNYIYFYTPLTFGLQNTTVAGASVTFYNPGLPTDPFTKGTGYLDGTLYLQTVAAFVRGSNFNDPQNWSTLNTIEAQLGPDAGIFTSKQLSYILAMKAFSVEAFRDAGNVVGSPLASVPGARVTVGCRHAGSVRSTDTSVYWIGRVKGGAINVMKMESMQAQVVSTAPVERLLQMWDYSTIWSWVAQIDGHAFYGITSKVSDMTLVYDSKSGEWTQWTDVNGHYWPVVDATTDSNQVPLFQHETNGKMYKFQSTIYQDDGAMFTVDLITPSFDAETKKRKYLKILDVVADQVNGGTLFLRCSDDDYQTWTPFRQVSLSQKRPFLTDCGTFYRRAYHLRYKTNLPLRIKALEYQIDIGTL